MSSLHLSVYLPTSTYQWCEQKQKHKQLQWSLDLASDIWQFKRSLQFPQHANNYNPSTGTIAYYFQFRVLIYSFSVSMSAKLKQATHQRYIHETGLKRPEMLHIIWSSMYPWFQPHTWRSYNQKVSVWTRELHVPDLATGFFGLARVESPFKIRMKRNLLQSERLYENWTSVFLKVFQVIAYCRPC